MVSSKHFAVRRKYSAQASSFQSFCWGISLRCLSSHRCALSSVLWSIGMLPMSCSTDAWMAVHACSLPCVEPFALNVLLCVQKRAVASSGLWLRHGSARPSQPTFEPKISSSLTYATSMAPPVVKQAPARHCCDYGIGCI